MVLLLAHTISDRQILLLPLGKGICDDGAHSSNSHHGNSSSEPELQSDNSNTHAEKVEDTECKDPLASGGPVAMCRCDVYSWEHRDYSLAGDESDPGMGRFALEALLHFCPQGMMSVDIYQWCNKYIHVLIIICHCMCTSIHE